MKKNFIDHSELDLILLCKRIFNEKKKIILIIFASVLMTYIYNSQSTNLFKTSLNLKANKNTELLMIASLMNSLTELDNLKNNSIVKAIIEESDPNKWLRLFVRELMDYDELIFVLKNNSEIFQENNLSASNEISPELKSFTKLLSVDFKDKKSSYAEVNFQWYDKEEGKKILTEILRIVSINIKNSFIEKAQTLLEIEKRQLYNKDVKRIEYLLEQSLIAKELNIVESQLDFNARSTDVTFNINTDTAYYLRGYIAIDKEIELIKKRENKIFQNIQEEINILKNIDIKWVDYDTRLMHSKSQNGYILRYILSAVIGLIVGCFYVITSNVFVSHKAIKGKKF